MSTNIKTRPGINLQSREVQVDPFPTYTLMRNDFPICQVEPDGIWAISRFDDVQWALKSPAIFSSAAFKTLYEPDWLREDCRRDHSILSQDPPKHTKYRAIISKAFVHRVIDGMIPMMRQRAVELLDKIPANKPIEFITCFADPYIEKLSGHVTGTDAYRSSHDIRRLIELTQVIRPVRPSDEHLKALEEATLDQRNHFMKAIQRRRESPKNDIITAAINAEVDEEKLDDEMLINLLDLLLHAGFMTVTNSLTHAIVLLARKPDLLVQLQRNPERIPAFIEEVLRFEPPSHNLVRQTTENISISGVSIPEGSLVFLLLASANRDPEHFPEPDKFDIHRPNIRDHIAFGYGPHTCIGSALARLEMKIAIEEIVKRFDSISVPPDRELNWAGALLVHAVLELPVVFS